jgi:hypothetical protein
LDQLLQQYKQHELHDIGIFGAQVSIVQTAGTNGPAPAIINVGSMNYFILIKIAFLKTRSA